MRLPIRAGGLGIRSNVETRHAAVIGGVEQALPHFTKDSGICSSLEDIVGDFKENNTNNKEANCPTEGVVKSNCSFTFFIV